MLPYFGTVIDIDENSVKVNKDIKIFEFAGHVFHWDWIEI
jgi:hypothetical protein